MGGWAEGDQPRQWSALAGGAVGAGSFGVETGCFCVPFLLFSFQNSMRATPRENIRAGDQVKPSGILVPDARGSIQAGRAAGQHDTDGCVSTATTAGWMTNVLAWSRTAPGALRYHARLLGESGPGGEG
jgi:hypothetical protein